MRMTCIGSCSTFVCSLPLPFPKPCSDYSALSSARTEHGTGEKQTGCFTDLMKAKQIDDGDNDQVTAIKISELDWYITVSKCQCI